MQILCYWSTDLVGIAVVRHGYAYCAQRGVCVWPRVRRSIFFMLSSEVSFEVLSCFAQLEGSMLLIYRKEIGTDHTVSRGLRFIIKVAIYKGLL